MAFPGLKEKPGPKLHPTHLYKKISPLGANNNYSSTQSPAVPSPAPWPPQCVSDRFRLCRARRRVQASSLISSPSTRPADAPPTPRDPTPTPTLVACKTKSSECAVGWGSRKELYLLAPSPLLSCCSDTLLAYQPTPRRPLSSFLCVTRTPRVTAVLQSKLSM